MQPHRWQPTRLHRPWDSPGKNTEVGCHFLLQCMKVKSESEVAQSCPTQRPHGLKPTRLLQPWDFPGKNTGVGCHCLLWLLPIHPPKTVRHIFPKWLQLRTLPVMAPHSGCWGNPLLSLTHQSPAVPPARTHTHTHTLREVPSTPSQPPYTPVLTSKNTSSRKPSRPLRLGQVLCDWLHSFLF